MAFRPTSFRRWIVCLLAVVAAGCQPTTSSLSGSPPGAAPPPGMVWISGGSFDMGCEDPRSLPHGGPDPMNDARPIHRVHVDGFWMDATEVTNAEFAAFVEATGYVTVAERTPAAEIARTAA